MKPAKPESGNEASVLRSGTEASRLTSDTEASRWRSGNGANGEYGNQAPYHKSLPLPGPPWYASDPAKARVIKPMVSCHMECWVLSFPGLWPGCQFNQWGQPDPRPHMSRDLPQAVPTTSDRGPRSSDQLSGSGLQESTRSRKRPHHPDHCLGCTYAHQVIA